MSGFIDERCGRFGVEPIRQTLGVSASAYYQRASGQRSRRAVHDEWLLGHIERLNTANKPLLRLPRGWRSSATGSRSVVTGSSG